MTLAPSPPPLRARTDDPLLDHAIPLIVERVRRRFPDADPELVSACLAEAIRRADSARVRSYLPVLVERWTKEAIAESTPHG